jgi:Flp pilus assembly protein TadD
VKLEPEDPDAWFMRAQAALAVGDGAAARSDMQQALAVAPKDWSTRPDVARFLARQFFAPQKPN